jgi:hypothetical protein
MERCTIKDAEDILNNLLNHEAVNRFKHTNKRRICAFTGMKDISLCDNSFGGGRSNLVGKVVGQSVFPLFLVQTRRQYAASSKISNSHTSSPRLPLSFDRKPRALSKVQVAAV